MFTHSFLHASMSPSKISFSFNFLLSSIFTTIGRLSSWQQKNENFELFIVLAPLRVFS
jgi:hypothetical protein